MDCARKAHHSEPVRSYNHLWGARGEVAWVKKVYSICGKDTVQKWNGFAADHLHINLSALPDIVTHSGLLIDTKTITNPNHQLMVQSMTAYGNAGVKAEWVYILVDASDHPRYKFLGWVFGSQLLSTRPWRPRNDRIGTPSEEVYSMHSTSLSPCEELLGAISDLSAITAESLRLRGY
jgi:hypothetical protein